LYFSSIGHIFRQFEGNPGVTNRINWPENKTFAFTVFDDTDYATVENVAPVYTFLRDLGFRTTKSVWPNRGTGKPICGGETLESPDYLAWVRDLQEAGFEIGLHMNTYHTSTRDETAEGLLRFAELIGHRPKTMSNHAGCGENIYWGSDRLSGTNGLLYNVATLWRNSDRYRGHIEGDPLFWGDLCREHVTYVRSFVYPEINSLKVCPFMPYHDPTRPYVNYWFVSAEGPRLESFVERLSEVSQDRLEAEGGACIMYTHFACGFYQDNRLNPRFIELMTRLSRKNGWFVPVGTLLDFLKDKGGGREISDRERMHLERRWLRNKLFRGTS
jgi:hypothetical protein